MTEHHSPASLTVAISRLLTTITGWQILIPRTGIGEPLTGAHIEGIVTP